MPVAVPTMPCARLKWPLPNATSATISGIITLNTAAVMPSNTCTATSRYGSLTVANSRPRIASAAKPSSSSGRRPHCCALRPTDGEVSATMACGTTMQAAISTGAHWLDRVVTTPAISGSIAALASCSSSTLPAKISSGRWRIRLQTLVALASATSRTTAPCARAASISRSRIRISASKVGIARMKVTRNTERLDKQIAAGAHHGRGDAVAERGIAGVAPEPLADRKRPDQAEADRGNRRTEHATRGGVQGRGGHHHRKDRPRRISERADADGRNRKARHQPFGARGIDDGAARHLSDQADDAADRQHKADLDLGPFLRRQIDRDERPEPGLHIGEKEDEPVEAAQALARRSGDGPLWPAARRRRIAADRPRRDRRHRSGLDRMSWVRARTGCLLSAALLVDRIAAARRLPEAPSTTIGEPSLYSGAAFT